MPLPCGAIAPRYGRSSARFIVELDHLFALLQDDVRLLPVGPPAHEASLPLHLAVDVGHPHVGDLHPEERLDRLLDLRLGRVAVHLEAERTLLFLERGRLLRDQRPAEDLVEGFHGCSRSSSLPSASWETSSVRQSSTS